jgi:hypothetical protein
MSRVKDPIAKCRKQTQALMPFGARTPQPLDKRVARLVGQVATGARECVVELLKSSKACATSELDGLCRLPAELAGPRCKPRPLQRHEGE